MASMKERVDLTGEIFERWFVLGIDETYSHKHTVKWSCLCECGTMRGVEERSLLKGGSKSCGCYAADILSKMSARHGESHTRLFSIWCGMKRRCFNPNELQYKYYGGRGITMILAWKEDYTAFRDWALVNGYKDNLSIERKDYNGDYCPENCTWIPRSEQSKNRRSASDQLMIQAWGETKSLTEWTKDARCIVSREVLKNRIKEGVPSESAMTTQYSPEVIVIEENRGKAAHNQHVYLIEMYGEVKTFTDWVKDDRCVVKNEEILSSRIIRYGWSVQRAFTQPVDEVKSRKKSVNQ